MEMFGVGAKRKAEDSPATSSADKSKSDSKSRKYDESGIYCGFISVFVAGEE